MEEKCYLFGVQITLPNGVKKCLTFAIFTSKALDEVHKASKGIPRIINRICEKTLMYAYQQQKRLIDDYMIRFVVEHELLNLGTN